MTQICAKCAKIIEGREFIRCANCKKFFHLYCTSIGEKFFYLMKPETRTQNQCDYCKYAEPSTSDHIINVPTSNPFDTLSEDELNYVTQRRPKRRSLPDLTTSFPLILIDADKSSQSLPETGVDPLTRELKERIMGLQMKLEIADNEIINLNTENRELKETITKQEKIIHLYKTVGVDDLNSSKNGLYKMSTPIGKNKLKRKSLRLESFINTPIRALPVTPITESQKAFNNKNIINSDNDCNTSRTNEQNKNLSKRRLCIISNIEQNKRSRMIRNHFERMDMQMCHYRIPGGGISQLLSELREKLEGYTLNDFCILFIGENDFELSKSYISLVKQLKNSLLEVQHTNIILCAPTFKYHYCANVYNGRIETFNDLLYNDNLINEYCYLIDSNLNLHCSFDMYSKYNGKINNHGVRTILYDIDKLILDFDKESDVKPHKIDNIDLTTNPKRVEKSRRHSFRS
jgi:hypothetical protein